MMGSVSQMQARQAALKIQIFLEARQRREAWDKRLIEAEKELAAGTWESHQCWSGNDREGMRQKYLETGDMRYAKMYDKMTDLQRRLLRR